MDNVKVTLELTAEDAVLLAEALEGFSFNQDKVFERREQAFKLHDYVNRRILEECGEI